MAIAPVKEGFATFRECTPGHRSRQLFNYGRDNFWSRSDGTILFNTQVQSYGFNQDVLRLNPTTNELTAVTDLWGDKAHVIAPAVAPDGSQIAVVQIHPDQPATSHICLVEPPGLRPLTDPSRETTRNPRWFPDGRRLLFTRGAVGKQQIFVIPATGGPPIALTPPDTDSRDPDVWSPR